ncbi:MAG: hypothetical protein V4615_04890 [Bacteroidota bacterium]
MQQFKTLREKYLPVLIGALLLCSTSFGQYQSINAYGYNWQRGRFDVSLRPPTDTLSGADVGSMAYKNGVWYGKLPSAWVAIGGGSGGADSALFATRFYANQTFQPIGNYLTATSLTNYYTKANINSFFSGATPIAGYNKGNWDAAYGWGNHNGLYPTISRFLDSIYAVRASITTGAGDMTKAIYDLNNDGVVDDAEKFGGQPPSYYATAAALSGKLNVSDSAAMLANYRHWLQGYLKAADLSGYLPSSTAASTYQPLDGDLTSIAGLSGTGFLKKTGTNTVVLDNTTYQQQLTLTTTGSGAATLVGAALNIPNNAGGSTPGINDVLALGQAFTDDRTINTQFHNFSINNADNIVLSAEGGGDITLSNYNGINSTFQTVKVTPSSFLWNADTVATRAYARSVSSGSSGETNTASNLGGGLSNYDSKSGEDLRFNSFASSDFDLASNVLSIDATLKSTWDAKQNALVSGTDIKTINGASVLGPGNISISGAAPTITTSSTSATIVTTYTAWVFTGTTNGTFTLPQVSGNTAALFKVKNRGSASLTVQRSGSDQIFDGSPVASVILMPGDAMEFQNDGTYWITF